MDELRQHYLAVLGIQRWVERERPVEPDMPESHATSAEGAAAQAVELPAQTHAAGQAEVATLGWEALRARVADCVACPELAAQRTQTVFGVGDPAADLLLIGEAPGAEEDAQGEPFVGRAGKLLDNMLQAMGLRREAVYIANILKCRPPNNRDPHVDEAAHCEPYLQRQIALIQPRLILVVGRIAAQNLLKCDTPIGKLRGQLHYYKGQDGRIPVIVTYHPAYLLRSPAEKRKAWEDLKMACETLEARQA